MITFCCNKKDCQNEGIEYNMLGNSETALCGGCKETLTGTDERPDPELPADLEI